MTINKKELVSRVAGKLDVTKKLAEEFVNAHWEVIREAISDGEDVNLIGIVKFEVRETKERQGTNPQDPQGPKITIPAGRRVSAKAMASLQNALEG